MTCKGTSLSGARRSVVDVRPSRLTTRFAVLMGGVAFSLIFMKIGHNDNPDKGICGALHASVASVGAADSTAHSRSYYSDRRKRRGEVQSERTELLRADLNS